MKRTLFLPLVALALAACADKTVTSVEKAAVPRFGSVHLKGGANAQIGYNDLGLQLNSSSDLSGLGNGDVFVGLSAHANAIAVCKNPGSKLWEPAGRNPAPVEITGGQAIPAGDLKNGTLHFSVTTQVPADAGPRPAADGECNGSSTGSWTYKVSDLLFTDATVSVYQPSDIYSDPIVLGPLVFQMYCTFTPQTSNGVVSRFDVSCS